MSATTRLDVKGLVLAPGELSRAPGSLTTADNVNVEAPGIIRSRNGVARQAGLLGGPAWKLLSSKELGSIFLFNTGSASAASALKFGDGTTAPTSLGTVTNQPATRMQGAISRINHYLTGDEGVRRIESDLSFAFAGMPKGLGLSLTGPTAVLVPAHGSGTGVVLADTESCAYRVTWCKKDVEGVVMEGSPGARTVVFNDTFTTGWFSGDSKNVLARILVPKQELTANTALTTSYFYRLYRSQAAAAGISPSDDMNLVAEAYLTSTDISNGYVDVTDATPEAFRALGAPLYTNQGLGGDQGVGGPGISQSNDAPPRAHDVVLFSECLFYSDLQFRHELDFTILSTVAGTGLTAGDTLTIGGIVYTAIAPGAPANNQFVVVTVAAGATASAAVERTAQNLCEAINRSTTNTSTRAFYASGPNDLPGKVHLEQRIISTGFTALASAHGTAYRPSLASAVASTADVFPNGYCFSKPSQGDAVPPVNVGLVGRNDTAILRMQVLRDSIYFFTDSGLYRLTGRSFDEFALQEFDLSFRLLGREMVAVCDDYIYAWGYGGIARISSAGVEYVSNSIEPLVRSIVSAAGLDWFAAYAWAAAYRSQHKVIFAVPDSGSTGNCSTALVFDTRMQAWTRWVFPQGTDVARTRGHSCGAVRVSDDLLFLGQWNTGGGDSQVFKERRTYAAADYVDDSYSDTNLAITKTVTWSAAAPAPQMTTHWDELHLFYDVSPTFSAWTTPTTLTIVFSADFGTASPSSSLAPTASSRMSRALVPQAQRRSTRLAVTVAHATASEYFGLEGMSLVHDEPEGTETVRT